jgi:hypothetical protein
VATRRWVQNAERVISKKKATEETNAEEDKRRVLGWDYYSVLSWVSKRIKIVTPEHICTYSETVRENALLRDNRL